jgi:hypothetical protein
MPTMWVRKPLLAKIDDSIAKISEDIRLTRESVERSEKEFELSREEIRLSRESREEMRDFMRDMLQRNERVFRDMSAGIREILTEVREGRKEQRAQTQALLRLIDRMDRLNPGGAAA